MTDKRLEQARDHVGLAEQALDYCLRAGSEDQMRRCAADALIHAMETKDDLEEATSGMLDLVEPLGRIDDESRSAEAALYHINHAIDHGRRATAAQNPEEMKRSLDEFKTHTDESEAFIRASLGEHVW